MVTETRRRGCDGIIGGHIHKPELKTVDGSIYGNDEDLVESLSALVEHHDGSLELLDWCTISKTTQWENVASWSSMRRTRCQKRL